MWRGAILIVALTILALPVRAAPTDIDGDWQLVAALGVGMPPGAYAKFDNGKLTGSTGCNRFFGTFEVTVNTYKSGPVSATKIYCHERRHVDRTFLAALETVTVFEQSGDTLVMHYQPGDKMLEFKRGRVLD